jgi:hypothetical protein
MVVRQASPIVKPVEARLSLVATVFMLFSLDPRVIFVMNKYLYY